MSCAVSKETIALYVENDLSGPQLETTMAHLAACDECRRLLEQLRRSQSLLKSLRRQICNPSECSSMRREVMSIIDDQRIQPGWALRVERTIVLGFRRQSYALAAFVLVAVASASALAQLRHAASDTRQSAVLFEGNDTLFLPEHYRNWIEVSRFSGSHLPGIVEDDTAATRTSIERVNINRSGYREYARTGRFPEGTLMIWESENREPRAAGSPHRDAPVLLASVKDSARFAGGWGFFDFTGSDGHARSRAEALPESSGCRVCHRRDAETDHVFTQFYPMLRSVRLGWQGATVDAPRGNALTEAELFAFASSLPQSRPPAVVHVRC